MNGSRFPDRPHAGAGSRTSLSADPSPPPGPSAQAMARCSSHTATGLAPRAATSRLGPTWSRVFEDKVLIVKFLPVDGLAPSAVVVREIAALAHELRDDAVEATSLEAKALLVGAQASEILWHGDGIKCRG